ncbi:MAG: radical SAM family heme chaperone HemW [Candidatus Omnitrophica bacterium]|nr:radical SAM family heme chaperone HemW [Candidatus Omnitrophota bacterium]
MEKALYIHIPFCRRKCVYCAFHSVVYDERTAASYISALTDQIEKLNSPFATVYIGGGTPTALDMPLLEKLLAPIKRFLPAISEFTVEANPESLTDEKMALFLESGVNRLSIGVQSMREQKLKKLGRLHSARQAIDAVRRANKRGFKNINIDLIYGVWGEEVDSWKKEIREAVELPVTHISCYGLTYEKETPLWEAVRNSSVKPLEDDAAAAMYELAIDSLALRGFKQYEVSNFAKEGFGCRHNLTYWSNDPYVGLGASAVSYKDGSREENLSDIDEYIRRCGEGKTLIVSSEKLPPAKRAKETAAVKIRTKEGIDFEWFRQKTGFDFMELEKNALPELVENGLLKYRKEGNVPMGISLKRKGFLLCDSVSSSFL